MTSIKNKGIFVALLLIASCSKHQAFAQESSVPSWDNQIFFGNKVATAYESFRFSGELQTRFNNNMETLDRWYLESSTNYLHNERWEFVVPLRYSIKNDLNEFRMGGGALYKQYPKNNIQIVHQAQYQADMTTDDTRHGARYVAFFNYVKNEKVIPNAVAGLFYRWSEEFNGVQFIRAGAGVSYVMDVKHLINFSYFLGMTNDGDQWGYSGVIFVQLAININKNYKYLPAKYYNF